MDLEFYPDVKPSDAVGYLGRRPRHGATAGRKMTRTYAAWLNMRMRCGNANRRDWKHYGGRGITVCARWNLFENFLQDMGEVPEGLTLDRINVNGNYEPGNCRWVSWIIQQQNKRRVTHCGQGHLLSPDNCFVRKNGSRACKICHKEGGKKRREAKYVQRCAETGKPVWKRKRKAPVYEALINSPLRKLDLVR